MVLLSVNSHLAMCMFMVDSLKIEFLCPKIQGRECVSTCGARVPIILNQGLVKA